MQLLIFDDTTTLWPVPTGDTTTFGVGHGTKVNLRRSVMGQQWCGDGGSDVQGLPVVLVTEDEQLVQNVVEEALAEGGFETAAATTGEEAVSLLEADHTRYRALVTDIHLAAHSMGGCGSRRSGDQRQLTRCLYDRCCRGRMGIKGRA